MSMIRSRWAAVGAAVAITLGAGGVSLTHAALSSGDKPVYVSLDAPCRVIDTRSGNPIAAGDAAALTVQITGANGDCTGPLAIPADAVGVATNVTVIQPNGAADGRSYFTVYPTGATRPTTSNLNFVNGQAPTPNKVDVGIGTGGRITIYNDDGTAHAAVDIFGYYIDHHHDDRYYTEGEVDSALGAKANSADVYTKAEVDGGFMQSTQTLTLTTYGGRGGTGTNFYGCSTVASGATMKLDLPLPVGAVPTAASFVYDEIGAGVLNSTLRRATVNPGSSVSDNQVDIESPGDAFYTRVEFDSIPPGQPPASDLSRYYFQAFNSGGAGVQVCGVSVTYTVDASAAGMLVFGEQTMPELACDGVTDHCEFAD